MQNVNRMPLRLGALTLWYLAVYLIAVRLRDFTALDAINAEMAEWSDPHLAALKISSSVAFLSYSLVAYLILYVLQPKFRWWVILPALAAGTISCILFRSFLEEVVIYQIFGQGNYNPNMSWEHYVLDNLYYAIVFTSLGIIFYFVQLSRHNALMVERTTQLQHETELKFLRSQVNPHFLFNTLNNLYALVHTGSAQALPALEKLSGLLRYALYEQEATVALKREVDYLKDLLHLESLRVDGLAPPQVTIGPFSRPWQLPPLLLVPFVENAFKHGDLRDVARPLVLSLTEKAEGDLLVFRVENVIRANVHSTDQVGGIGLTNVLKRLELLYPGRHRLTAVPLRDTFVVELVLSTKQLDTVADYLPEVSKQQPRVTARLPGWSR